MQDLMETAGMHLVLYDAACGLCNYFLQFLLVHDHKAAFSFASLQSPIGKEMVKRFGGNPEDLDSFYVLANFRTPCVQAFTKSRAAIFVATELGCPWKVLGAVSFLPRKVLDWSYDLIARNRYRIFGRRDKCVAPGPHVRRRFVE